MSEEVVIDAILAAMWALPEPHSQKALMLAHDWARPSGPGDDVGTPARATPARIVIVRQWSASRED